jgi:hypothetical protein
MKKKNKNKIMKNMNWDAVLLSMGIKPEWMKKRNRIFRKESVYLTK